MPLPAKITGKITDAAGVGIVGASAICAGISTKTTTGGAYLLLVTAAGTQTVTGSMAGRTSASVTVATVSGGAVSAPVLVLK
jgi:hypothetical protein